MACKEIAALRLGLMNLLAGAGSASAARKHDLAELGDAATQPGPLRALSECTSFSDLVALYKQCLNELQAQLTSALDQEQVVKEHGTRAKHLEQIAYYQSLMILNRKVEMEITQHQKVLQQLLQDLDEIHHYVHQLHPPTAE